MVDAIKRQHGEAIAEFNNARARLKREVGREVQTSLKSLIAELLETLDNLDRAIEAASSKSEESELLTGVIMIRDQFVAKLSQLGVQRIESKDTKFDPKIHEAVAMVPVPTPDLDGQIVGIIKEGYTMNGEVLRAAVVAVGQCATAEEPTPSPEEVLTEKDEESATE
jgi:molecular chaperone GrpE